MNAVRRAASGALVVLLAACASQPPVRPAPPPADRTGAGSAPLAADAVDAYQAEIVQALHDLAKRNTDIATTLAGAGLRLRRAAFESGDGQMRPAAFTLCAQLAPLAQRFDRSVVHLLGRGAPGATRADSFSSCLAARGVPATRLRPQGSGGSDADASLDLMFVPVVQGSEPQAWMPPAATP